MKSITSVTTITFYLPILTNFVSGVSLQMKQSGFKSPSNITVTETPIS